MAKHSIYHFQEWLPGLKRLAFLGGPRLDGRLYLVSQVDLGTFTCGFGWIGLMASGENPLTDRSAPGKGLLCTLHPAG